MDGLQLKLTILFTKVTFLEMIPPVLIQVQPSGGFLPNCLYLLIKTFEIHCVVIFPLTT